MKVAAADFVKSAFQRRDWPIDRRREVAFLGRSNVGKSSLLNSLLQRKGLARTSNTPGRTQSINFFSVSLAGAAPAGSDGFYFVDLPGYGYARVSKSMRSDWGTMAEEYLSDREELDLCIQLVDARHKPTELDLQLHEWLIFNQKTHVVVATKADKLSSNQLLKQLRLIESDMEGSRVIAYSSQTGKGRDQIWSAIASAIRKA